MIKEPGNILAYLDRAAIEAVYDRAPGAEIASGKFESPQSSAALVANAFGPFFATPERLPPIIGLSDLGWPAREVRPEAVLRFPWRGGRHPCLDLAITTGSALIGVESKRYEPFRPKASSDFSPTYWRDVWGRQMGGYQRLRDHLHDGSLSFQHLDAGQLVKHALGVLTAARAKKLRPVLLYLYTEPDAWPEGQQISRNAIERHRQEIAFFAHRVRADEVEFVARSYCELLSDWAAATDPGIRAHVAAVRDHFRIGDAEPLWRSDEPTRRPAVETTPGLADVADAVRPAQCSALALQPAREQDETVAQPTEPGLPERFPLLFNRRWPASRLTGDVAAIDVHALAGEYVGLRAAAPKRSALGKAYFVGHSGRPSTGDFTNRLEEHCAIALVGLGGRWPLPEGGWFELLDYQVPLKARRGDQGVGKVDLLGVTDGGRLVVAELKVSGAAGSRGEPPPCALMEALRYAAMIEADLPAIAQEARRAFDRSVTTEAPMAVLLAPSSWWRAWTPASSSTETWTSPFTRLTRGVEQLTGVSIRLFEWEDVPLELGLAGSRPQFGAPPVPAPLQL